MLWTLAARNLTRNVRRTLITVTAISLGLSMVIWVGNLQSWQHSNMLKQAISSMAGSTVVQAEGYRDDPEAKRVVIGATEVATKMRALFPDEVVTRRIEASGVLMSATNTVGIGLRGVEPEAEAQVMELDDKVFDGTWLAPDDIKGIYLGKSLAEKLDVQVGNKLVFMGQTDGEMSSRLFKVRGVFRTGGATLDSFVALAHIDALQELYEAEDVANQVALHLSDPTHAEEATRKVRDAISADGREILMWSEAIPDFVAFIEMDRQYNDFMWAVVGLMVAVGMLNTILMSVMERVREFGVMMSVGMRPRQLATMVLSEGILLGVVGSLIGLGLGAVFTWLNASYGLDLSGSYGEVLETSGVAMSTVFYAKFDVAKMSVNFVGAVFFTVLASAWPAWRVSQMRPIDAMRHQ